MNEETKTPTPHPALLLMLKILALVEAERDKRHGYSDAVAALEAAAVLLKNTDADEFGRPPATTFATPVRLNPEQTAVDPEDALFNRFSAKLSHQFEKLVSAAVHATDAEREARKRQPQYPPPPKSPPPPPAESRSPEEVVLARFAASWEAAKGTSLQEKADVLIAALMRIAIETERQRRAPEAPAKETE